MVALKLPDDPAEARRLLTAAGRPPEEFPGSVAWEPSSFEVDSGGPIDVGMDGEALRLPAPLRFTIRPGALRIRVPPERDPAPTDLMGRYGEPIAGAKNPETRSRRVAKVVTDLKAGKK